MNGSIYKHVNVNLYNIYDCSLRVIRKLYALWLPREQLPLPVLFLSAMGHKSTKLSLTLWGTQENKNAISGMYWSVHISWVEQVSFSSKYPKFQSYL